LPSTDTEERFTPKDRLLTPAQVSEWTGLSVDALAQQRFRGTGPRYRALTAKTIRYLESDVQAFIEASARTSTAEHAHA
jgi:predicted DNA-binding transcriptional regulator AlpA